MPLTFITDETDCEAIRELVHLTHDRSTIPSATIYRDTVGGVAERWVKARTLNVDLNTEAGQRAKSAALHYAAALLVTRVAWVRTEDLPGGRVSLQDTDIKEKQAQLFGTAQDEISRSEELNRTIEDPPDDSSSPLLFEVASVADGRVEGTVSARPWWEQ